MFCKNIQYFLFLDEPFSALPYIFWLIRPDMPFFTGFPGFRGALPAPLLTQPPSAAPTIPRRTPKKIHPWIFFGLKNRFAILHALSRHPWLFTNWQVRAKNPALDFFWIEESLRNSSCAKPPIHGLFTNWQVRAKKIHPCILPGLQNCKAILHAAKPPSMAFYELASTLSLPASQNRHHRVPSVSLPGSTR